MAKLLALMIRQDTVAEMGRPCFSFCESLLDATAANSVIFFFFSFAALLH